MRTTTQPPRAAMASQLNSTCRSISTCSASHANHASLHTRFVQHGPACISTVSKEVRHLLPSGRMEQEGDPIMVLMHTCFHNRIHQHHHHRTHREATEAGEDLQAGVGDHRRGRAADGGHKDPRAERAEDSKDLHKIVQTQNDGFHHQHTTQAVQAAPA